MSHPAAHAGLAVEDAVVPAAAALREAGIAEPRREAQLLLAHVLEADRAYVLAHPGAPLDAVTARRFRALIARRACREPHAYLTGQRAWLDLLLQVDRNVLIPRPETELLAQAAIAEVARRRQGEVPATGMPVVVDVGTGSGALAIAVARACPGAVVNATDTSAGALRMAARNVARLAPGRVMLLRGDLLAPIRTAADIVVANLPYIPTADLALLEPELAFEPRCALDGGADGLDAIRALLRQAPVRLAPGATLLLECGYDQAARIAALAAERWPGACIESHADLAGFARFVHIYMNSCHT